MTMLATSVRVRPWSCLWTFCSLGRRDDDRVALAGDEHVRVQVAVEGALGPLDRDRPAVDGDIDPGGDGDGQATDA